MAAKTLEKLISPIAVRLRRTAPLNYKRANSQGFDVFDASKANANQSESLHMNTNVPETQDCDENVSGGVLDSASPSLTNTDIPETQECVSNDSSLLDSASESSILIEDSQDKQADSQEHSILSVSSPRLANSTLMEETEETDINMSSSLLSGATSPGDSSVEVVDDTTGESQQSSADHSPVDSVSDNTILDADNPPDIMHSPQTEQQCTVGDSVSDATLLNAHAPVDPQNSANDPQIPTISTCEDDLIPLQRITDMFRSMETQVVAAIQSAHRNEETARLSATITNLKAQLATKDNSIRELKRDLSQKNAALHDFQTLKLRHEDTLNTKRGAESRLKIIEAQLTEAQKHIESLEDINRQLLSRIAPDVAPHISQQDTPDDSQQSAPPTEPREVSPVGIQPGSELTESRSSSSRSSNVTVNTNIEQVPGLESTEQRPLAQSESTAPAQQLPANNHHPQTVLATPDLSLLQPLNHSDQTDTSAAASLSRERVDVLFIGNSQFRYLNVVRLAQGLRSRVHAHVLDNKSIDGALQFFETYKPIQPPQIIALQVISNTLEAELNPDSIMSQMVDVISVINRNCPGSHIIIGVPLPRICTTPDLTRRYDNCRDRVEDRLLRLSSKRHNVSVVFSAELGSYTETLYRDKVHLSHSPQPNSAGRTGLGTLVRAYKNVIVSLINSHHDRPTFRQPAYPWKPQPGVAHQSNGPAARPQYRQRHQNVPSWPNRRDYNSERRSPPLQQWRQRDQNPPGERRSQFTQHWRQSDQPPLEQWRQRDQPPRGESRNRYTQPWRQNDQPPQEQEWHYRSSDDEFQSSYRSPQSQQFIYEYDHGRS